MIVSLDFVDISYVSNNEHCSIMNHEKHNKNREKMDKRLRVRVMILNEIVSTEQVYSKNLLFLAKV